MKGLAKWVTNEMFVCEVFGDLKVVVPFDASTKGMWYGRTGIFIVRWRICDGDDLNA